MKERRRVVITGIGAMTPLGLTMKDTWEGFVAGRSGIGPITQFDASDLPTRIAGEIKGFNPKEYIDSKEARRMSRCSQISIAIAQEAMRDAGLEMPVPREEEERVGVLIGSAVGGFERALDGVDVYRNRGLSRVSPFVVTSLLVNMPSHHVSLWAQAKGPISTVVAACATGTQAAGEASEFIRRGAADVMICGGVEALIHFVAIVGFCAMRALSSRNDEPERASRPFDADRDGFVFSEGGAMLVLESLEHAQERGARIYAEVLGHASSSDAFHVAQPDPEGLGASRAMQWALDDAGLKVIPQQEFLQLAIAGRVGAGVVEGYPDPTAGHIPPIHLLLVYVPGLDHALVGLCVAPLGKALAKEIICHTNDLTEEASLVGVSDQPLDLNAMDGDHTLGDPRCKGDNRQDRNRWRHDTMPHGPTPKHGEPCRGQGSRIFPHRASWLARPVRQVGPTRCCPRGRHTHAPRRSVRQWHGS